MSQVDNWLSSEVLISLLKQHPEGLSEYQLLNWLKEQGYIQIDTDAFQDMMKLFRVHFLIFHRLYRLQDELHRQQLASLSIHALNIQLIPYADTQPALTLDDPLKRYYLDWSHLEETDQAELDAMLNQFWQKYTSITPHQGSCDQRSQALEVLELEGDPSDVVIKKAWRRLAMKHHPDRGGDEARIKRLNEAVSILLS